MKSTELAIISKACACRSFLYIAGFLTDVESEKIHGKIRKYQDKHRQNVSTDDLASVRIVMSDETDQLTQRIAELETAKDNYKQMVVEQKQRITELETRNKCIIVGALRYAEQRIAELEEQVESAYKRGYDAGYTNGFRKTTTNRP